VPDEEELGLDETVKVKQLLQAMMGQMSVQLD